MPAVAIAQACVEELEDRKQQQSQQQHLEPDRAGRRSWLLGREKAAAGGAKGAGAGGAKQQQGGPRQSASSLGGPAGASPSWPTLHELVHRNAHYHMQQRVAELEARHEAWEQAHVPVQPPV